MAMFFPGTLQEAISAAVQQSKIVFSFVTDGESESQSWEEYLAEDSVASLLKHKAIALKIQAGSQEANYLAAIYPIPKTPTLVIMASNGQLKEYIAAGVSKNDLRARIAGVFGESVSAPTSTEPATGQESARGTQSADPSSTSSSGQATPPPSYQDQLAERAERLAAERKKEAEEAARRRKEKGKAKAEPEFDAGDGDQAGKPKSEKQKVAQQLRQRKIEAEQERQRILRQIEHDRAERKARDEARKEARRAEAMMAQEDGEEEAAPATQMTPIPSARRHEFCALQVRLFDGSTLRTRLASSSNVRNDLRKWVDENRGDGNAPYTFRVIFPNRVIDETEEDQSLEALSLTPSSTLVLIPVDKFSSAYSDADAGIVRRFVAFIVHFFNMIIAFFTTIFTGAPRQEAPAGQTVPDEAAGQDANRIRGFQNRRDGQRDYQLYNGNSLNFEPRNDDDGQEDTR